MLRGPDAKAHGWIANILDRLGLTRSDLPEVVGVDRVFLELTHQLVAGVPDHRFDGPAHI